MNPIHAQISSRSSRHAPIPFHLNRSARPRYQTWTRSCWSFHDDLFDRAERRSLARGGGAPRPTTLEEGQGQGGWHSMPLLHIDISSCRLTWHPGILTVGTPSTGAIHTGQKEYKRSTLLSMACSVGCTRLSLGIRLRPPTATAAWSRRSKLRGHRHCWTGARATVLDLLGGL